MKINLYNNYLTKIPASGNLVYTDSGQIIYNNGHKQVSTNGGGEIDNPSYRLPSGMNSSNTKICGIHPGMVIMLVINMTLFSPIANATVTGPGSAWGFYRKVNLSAATSVANFQVKVSLTTGQYANMSANGNDLRFYDINNNVCDYYIETWNNGGTSVIWVKVPVSGTNALYLYYGNGAAPATSNGANVFDFFDDFTTPLAAKWITDVSGGSVTQAGTSVSLNNTNAGNVLISNASPFSLPSSTSFIVETKHREVGYNRNRFYATVSPGGGSPTPFDYGYFSTAGTSQNASKIFWNGFLPSGNGTLLSNNTDYLTRWNITDGSTYNWFTFNYNTGVALDATARNTTVTATIRYITIQVTEVANTSTIIDWVRVRRATGSFAEITGNAAAQFTNLSAGITTQINVLCNGKSTGSATVTVAGGGAPYTYLWNSSPLQNSPTAVNLPAGTFTVTVTDINGFSALATVIITEPLAVIATAVSSHIKCFNANDGQITITGSNGVVPYEFSINNGASYQDANTFNGLSPGEYKIRVRDGNGCESKSVE
jgi:hypothetical protein